MLRNAITSPEQTPANEWGFGCQDQKTWGGAGRGAATIALSLAAPTREHIDERCFCRSLTGSRATCPIVTELVMSDTAITGAPEIEVTPEMAEAGERAIFSFGVTPDLSTADWACALASQVYRAMEAVARPNRPLSRLRNRAKQ